MPLAPVSQVREDFDAIARQGGGRGCHRNNHYLGWILRQVPRCESALDVGCGTGELTRLLRSRAQRVRGVDLSPAMIDAARRLTSDPDVAYEAADVMTAPFADAFDVVTSVATLHHLPLEPALHRLAALVRPGGTLVVLDLLETRGLRELPRNGLAWIVDRAWRIARNEPKPGPALLEAWKQHAAHDRYDTWKDIRIAWGAALPDALLRRHLFWRYSGVWRKPRNA